MLKEDRKTRVLRQLAQKGSVSVSELSDIFHISAVSVRKLLADMEGEGSIKRIWGGAMLANPPANPAGQTERGASPHHIIESEAIAKEAYAHIQDGETVFLDGGTLTLQQLASMLANGNKRRTLVCTNALPIALEFRYAEDIRLVFIGGQLRHDNLTCLGRAARQMLEHLSFDKCFLSARHFTIERGFSTDNLQEAEVKRALLATARANYFLVDFSAYGDDAFSLISPCEPGKRLITDRRMPAEVKERLDAMGMQVFLAPTGEF